VGGAARDPYAHAIRGGCIVDVSCEVGAAGRDTEEGGGEALDLRELCGD